MSNWKTWLENLDIKPYSVLGLLILFALPVTLMLVFQSQDNRSRASGNSPSGEEMPVGDLPGWKQIFTDDFTTNVPVGSFPSAVSSKWSAYPDGWKDTSKNGTYYSSKVVSIQNGILNKYLHSENGVPMVSAILPKLPSGKIGQLYGRYAIRFRADSVVGYKTAWLLWPDSENWPKDGEIDFPEGDLDSTISGFVHRQDATSGSDQDAFSTNTTYGDWHTAVTEWSPSKVVFILDGRVIGTSTNRVPNTSMHYVIQTETALDGTVPSNTAAGNVQIDWVALYEYSPTTSAIPTSPATTTTPSPSPVPNQGLNLIQNYSFEGTSEGTSGSTSWSAPWTFVNKTTNSTNTLTQDSSASTAGANSAKINVNTPDSTNPWNTQLHQSGLNLTSGAKYTISFDAKSSVNRTAGVNLQQSTTNTWLTGQTLNLTPSWQKYTLTYTSPSNQTAFLAYNLGQTTGTVWLDNVSVSTSSSPVLTPTPTTKPTSTPTPTLKPTSTPTPTKTPTSTPKPTLTSTPILTTFISPTNAPTPTPIVNPGRQKKCYQFIFWKFCF